MKHFYRMTLFALACCIHASTFGQNPASSSGKRVVQNNHNQQSKKPSKPSFQQQELNSAPTTTHSHQPSFEPSSTLKPGGSFSTATATPLHRSCFTVESEKKLLERYPSRLSTEGFEKKLSGRVSAARTSGDANTVYRIPTIVHVIHQGEPVGSGSNISYEQVMSQFDVLNEDFRKLGAGHNDHPDGADIAIEFVPVIVDPQGKLLKEPGVDRQFGYSAYYEYDPIELELKPNTQWDPNRYFNIWVLNFGGSLANMLGYAQFPSFSGLEGLPEDGAEWTDGVVIGYKYFGRTGNVVSPFDGGRTTTHEVGHWLGLRHIWGDGDCSVDDFCADTPNANGPNVSCDFRDSCPEEGDDMIENYMDYSTDGCMNIFTNDQKARIRTVLEVSPRRKSLIACQNATTAVAGINISDDVRNWFEYTAQEDEIITISSLGTTTADTRLSLYTECNGLPINISDSVNGMPQSTLTIGLNAGETVKILWESFDFFEPFEWTLQSNTPATGAACEHAAIAVEGNNIVGQADINNYWFSFSPTTDHQKITITSNGVPFVIYGNSCEQLIRLKAHESSATVYDISSDESIYIAFHSDSTAFDWSLTTDNLDQGESCMSAINAPAGENVIPFEGPFVSWYSYTMPFDGNLSIFVGDSFGGNARVAIFQNCNGQPIAEATGEFPSVGPIALNTGETVKILWESDSNTESFAWSLVSEPFSNGQVCDVAIPAELGINHTEAAPQWFTYTTTKLSNLRISSVGLTEANTQLIVKRECDGPITNDNDDYHSVQSELILYGTPAGEKIYILWSEKWDFSGFDWIIEEVDPLPGDNCNTAKPAVLGTNTVDYRKDHTNFGGIFWNKFTVPQSGKKITAFASIPIDMAIYANHGCETFTFVDSDQGKSRAINLAAGTELIIIWEGGDYTEDFTWELSIDDVETGDLCSDPIRAISGTNETSQTPMWYDYVMTQDGSIDIKAASTSTNTGAFIAVLRGCDEEATLLFQNTNHVFIPALSEGDHLSIYLTVGYPFTGATMEIEEVPLKQGDLCGDPLPASYGLNHADYATQWFTYTATETGNLKVSSRAFTYTDTDLYVYDGCNGNLLAQSNDIFSIEDFILYFQSEALVENVQEGQTILIKWAGTYSFEGFDWEIISDGPRPGDSCEDPLPAVEGVNNGMKPTPAWFTFTMPEDGALTLSSLGYTDQDTNVEVYDACDGNLLGSNDGVGDPQSFLSIDGLTAGQTVLIRWANGLASDQYTFNWRLMVGEPDPGLACQFPATANIGVNTTPDYVSTFYWYTFTMPEDNKKLVVKRLNTSETPLRTIGITADCERLLDYGIADDTVSITGLTAGQQVMIFFGELKLGERESFDWKLEVVDLATGDHCNDPLNVSPWNVIRATGADTWYTFDMPFNGAAKISSVDLNYRSINTYVEVYDGCDGTLIASNDNPDDFEHMLAEVQLEDLNVGTTLFVKWSTVVPFQIPFDWILTFENPNNHAPLIEDHSFQLWSPSNGMVIGTLNATDEDNDDILYHIHSGNNDGALALGEQTGELTIADATKIGVGRQIEVAVTDRMSTTMVTVTIDVVTSSQSDVRHYISVYPNPAADKLFIDISEGMNINRFYLTDTSGRIVRDIDPITRQMSLREFDKGLYFITAETNTGKYIHKVVIVK